jgi:SAM-dependent methyltransferase
MSIYNHIKFPHPNKNKNEEFIFEDKLFKNVKNRNETFEVLEFSKNDKGWTDELNEMSEKYIDFNHPIDDASRELCLEFLEKFDKSKDKVVLEVGCSNGRLINSIKKKIDYKYIGSDAVKNKILLLSKKYEDVPFLIFDLLKNPFKKSICNTLVMLNVLEHIENDNLALLEANKLLKENGILILEVPSGKFLYDDYDKKLLHYRRYQMNELVKKIENAGFEIEYKTHLGFIIFPVFAVVKLFNKIFKSKNIVTEQANASSNILLKILLSIEKKIRKFYLPFGIRCYVCARKKL